MTFSKLFFFGLSLSLVLTGCSTESRKKSKEAPGARTDFNTCAENTNFRVRANGFGTKSSSIPVYNSYGIPKKKTFNFQACLLERIGGAKITADIPFVIENSKGKKIAQRIADSEGCIGWQESFEYNHIQPETYIKLTRRIRALSTYSGCVSAEAAFNPWANGSAATNDLRNIDLPVFEADTEALTSKGKIQILGQAAPQIEIAVDSLNFEFKGLDYDNYSLDRHLNLTVAHAYTIRIKPSVIRRTLDTYTVPQALVGGRLKAYLAIFTGEKDSKVDQKSLITVEEFDMEYVKSTGQFMADVSLKFKNVSEMTSRTKAFLTLVPSDELEGLSEMNYQGLFKPAPLTALSLSPGNVSAYSFFKNQTKAPLSLKPFDTLKSKNSGLTRMTLDNPPSYGFATWNRSYNFEELVHQALYDKLTGTFKQSYLTSVLCQKLFPASSKNLTNLDCQTIPSSYIKVAVRHLVEDITSKPMPVNDTTVEDLEMKISFSESQKNSYSKGWKGTLGVGLSGTIGFDILSIPKEYDPLKGALSVKGSGGLDYNWVWEGKYAEEKSVGVTSSASTKITSEGNSFKFTANVRPCLFAVPTPAIAARLAKQNIVNNGIYFCGDQIIENQERTETWYLLTQSLGVKDSTFSDPLAKRAGPWRMMVRGQVPMLMFYNFLKDAKANLVLEKMPSEELRAEFEAGIMQMQEFPGLLPLK